MRENRASLSWISIMQPLRGDTRKPYNLIVVLLLGGDRRQRWRGRWGERSQLRGRSWQEAPPSLL